jgi:light-harvesting complex I chlorophyll a/b binding protein 1
MVLISRIRPRTLLSLIVSLLLCNISLAFRPPLVSEEYGCSPTLSLLMRGSRSEQFYFDPLGIADDANFARLREAELKHGRISMFAVAGTILTPFLKEVTDSVPKKYPNGVLPVLKSMSPVDMAKVILFCGVMETVIWVQRDPQDMPGDYGTGWLGVRDKGVHERQLISELENGRLAMIAVAGQVGAEIVTGQPWVDQWVAFFLKNWATPL